jgi:sarcosine oxidase subunit alpha
MAESITILVNGQRLSVPEGTVAAAAVARAGVTAFRRSVQGDARGPLCGMGICFECRITVNGTPHMRSCLVLCTDGMELCTDDRATD